MDNVFEIIETDSSDEESDSSSDTPSHYMKQTKFMNQLPMDTYEKNRNRLFTKQLLRKTIVIDSHNYFQPDGFNTSNFKVVFDYETTAGTSLVTTNYDIYHNVIGFRMMKTTIRTPPYNVNLTNNIIRYKVVGSNTIYTITINPGVYNMLDLADVFQKYQDAHTGQFESGVATTINTAEQAQFCTYSNTNVTTGTVDGSTFTPHSESFSVTFHKGDSNTSQSVSDMKGMIYEIKYNDLDNQVEFLWDYDNITRGAARLFGFLPKKKTSTNIASNVNQKVFLFSERMPDVSSHFVDLVIPDIPSIACKKNSSGRDIIERIQLNAGHGDYLHYHPVPDESVIQSYFSPIRLHRLNIQLYSMNNELYDTNNSDVSFEFEITMVKDKSLLS
jgi:hypothetical protein